MGKLIHDEKEGWHFISSNGVEYLLLEGMTLHGKATSDICFMMADFAEEVFDNHKFDAFVGWFFGATFVENNEDNIETLQYLANEYEKKHPEIVKYYMEKEKRKDIAEYREKISAKVYEMYKLMIEIDDITETYNNKWGDFNDTFFNAYLPVGNEYPFDKDWIDQAIEILDWSEKIHGMKGDAE